MLETSGFGLSSRPSNFRVGTKILDPVPELLGSGCVAGKFDFCILSTLITVSAERVSGLVNTSQVKCSLGVSRVWVPIWGRVNMG